MKKNLENLDGLKIIAKSKDGCTVIVGSEPTQETSNYIYSYRNYKGRWYREEIIFGDQKGLTARLHDLFTYHIRRMEIAKNYVFTARLSNDGSVLVVGSFDIKKKKELIEIYNLESGSYEKSFDFYIDDGKGAINMTRESVALSGDGRHIFIARYKMEHGEPVFSFVDRYENVSGIWVDKISFGAISPIHWEKNLAVVSNFDGTKVAVVSHELKDGNNNLKIYNVGERKVEIEQVVDLHLPHSHGVLMDTDEDFEHIVVAPRYYHIPSIPAAVEVSKKSPWTDDNTWLPNILGVQPKHPTVDVYNYRIEVSSSKKSVVLHTRINNSLKQSEQFFDPHGYREEHQAL